MTTWFRWVVCAAVVFAAGCSRRPGPVAEIEKVVPVEGILTFQGKPLEGYQVTFIPVDGRRPATGVTDASGKFVLGTNRTGDGAPPGKHKVAVVWAGPTSAGEPGAETVIDNPAKLPKPTVQIPSKYAKADSSGLTQEVPPGGIKDLKIDLK